MKIVFVGPIPPPIGGVSIHIQRLSQMLRKEGHIISFIDESPIIKVDTFNLRSLDIFPYLKIIKSADIVHLHSSVTIFRLFHLFICLIFKKNTVLTLHSWRVESKISQYFQRKLFSKIKKIICVNHDIYQKINLNNTIVQAAFIPPDMSVEPELPKHVEQWIKEQKTQNKIIIASNAYRLDIFNSIDLYGLDMAIKLIDFLVNEHKLNVALIFVVTTLNQNEKLFYIYKKIIREKKLTGNILLIHEKKMSYVKLIQKSDLTCRLTNTDGDALSIREAIHLNKPIIASDSAKRPDGTITFKTRNQGNLNQTVLSLLPKLNKYNQKNTVSDINFKVYKSIYNSSME